MFVLANKWIRGALRKKLAKIEFSPIAWPSLVYEIFSFYAEFMAAHFPFKVVWSSNPTNGVIARNGRNHAHIWTKLMNRCARTVRTKQHIVHTFPAHCSVLSATILMNN